jgi:hypothetical protein
MNKTATIRNQFISDEVYNNTYTIFNQIEGLIDPMNSTTGLFGIDDDTIKKQTLQEFRTSLITALTNYNSDTSKYNGQHPSTICQNFLNTYKGLSQRQIAVMQTIIQCCNKLQLV